MDLEAESPKSPKRSQEKIQKGEIQKVSGTVFLPLAALVRKRFLTRFLLLDLF
jgi:hypothetical protein